MKQRCLIFVVRNCTKQRNGMASGGRPVQGIRMQPIPMSTRTSGSNKRWSGSRSTRTSNSSSPKSCAHGACWSRSGLRLGFSTFFMTSLATTAKAPKGPSFGCSHCSQSGLRSLRQRRFSKEREWRSTEPNALAARVIADLGFKAVYLTGAGLMNMHLGLPDLGFMDLSQVADHVMAIRCVIDLPLIVDIDTGFGNAVNVTHTVRILEQAGASAIQI